MERFPAFVRGALVDTRSLSLRFKMFVIDANYARVFILLVFPNILFGLVAALVDPSTLIKALNGALIALSTGVVISYVVDTIKVLAGRKPMEKVHWLVLGITAHWVGTDGQRIWSLAWRWMGMPMDWVNNHFISWCLFSSACGAYYHLVASEAFGEERIPQKRWVRYGILAAAAIAVVLAIGYVVDRYMEAGVFSDPTRVG